MPRRRRPATRSAVRVQRKLRVAERIETLEQQVRTLSAAVALLRKKLGFEAPGGRGEVIRRRLVRGDERMSYLLEAVNHPPSDETETETETKPEADDESDVDRLLGGGGPYEPEDGEA